MTDSEDKPLRVVDKRHFTAEGQRRQPQQPREEQSPEPLAGEDAARQEGPPPAEGPAGSASPLFKELVMQIATSCMLHLGQLPNPVSQRAEVDLAAAGLGIDMLAMVKEKTRGNLAGEESDLLDDLLAQIRLSYYQATKGGGRP